MAKTEMLHPQDVLVACKIFAIELARGSWTFSSLAAATGLSAGEAHNAVSRCRQARLLTPGGAVSKRPMRDLLAVAVPSMMFAHRGGIGHGMLTALLAEPLAGKFVVDPETLPMVWARAEGGEGGTRGECVDPIYPTVPYASEQDPVVYELMALVDVVRLGNSAEKSTAITLIEKRLAR